MAPTHIISKGDRVTARSNSLAKGTVVERKIVAWDAPVSGTDICLVLWDVSMVKDKKPVPVFVSDLLYVEPSPAPISKPYLLFAWDSASPVGGSGDFVDSYETAEDAVKHYREKHQFQFPQDDAYKVSMLTTTGALHTVEEDRGQ